MAESGTTGGGKPTGRTSLFFQTFDSLSNRNVRLLFLGTFFTSAGNWLQNITLGYLAYQMTGNPVVVGTLLASRSIPWLLVGPFSGVIIDRVDRRLILVIPQGFKVVFAVGLGLIMLFDLTQVWHLYVYFILNGVCWTLDNPTRQAVAVSSVPRESYQNALSLLQLGFGAGRILFPIIGGIIIQVSDGATLNLFLLAVCYGLVGLAFSPVKLERASPSTSKARPSVFGDLVDGFRYVATQRATLGVIILGFIPPLFLQPFQNNLLPVFAEDVLDRDAAGLGILMSSVSVGSVIGTLLMATFSNVRKKGRLLIVVAFVSGLALIGLSQVDWFWLAMICLLFIGVLSSMYYLSTTTILMTLTPDNYRGRVATLFMLDHSGAPIGGLLAGGMAAWIDVQWSMFIGGLVTVGLVLLVVATFKAIRTAAEEAPVVSDQVATVA